MSTFTAAEEAEIATMISHPRLSRYIQDCGSSARGIAMYRWNAEISAGFMISIHFAEVAVRNGVSQALEAVYGSMWWTNSTFEGSLPTSRTAFDAKRELNRARAKILNLPLPLQTTGKLVAELKFQFWVTMFTKRFHSRVWSREFRAVFPHAPLTVSDTQARSAVHDNLDAVRRFRNRAAHHEPVYGQNLANLFNQTRQLLEWRSRTLLNWHDEIEPVSMLLAHRP